MENKEEKILEKATQVLVKEVDRILIEKGVVDGIEDAKKYIEKTYLTLIPKKLHKKYLPVLALGDGDGQLYIGWRDISQFINKI